MAKRRPLGLTCTIHSFALIGVVAFLSFYYFSHTSKGFASGKAEMNEARRQ